MKGSRQMQALTLTATLIALLLIAACEGDRKYVSPTGPDGPTPPQPPSATSYWSVTGTLISLSDPIGCSGSLTIGRTLNGHTWQITQTGSSLTIVTGEITDWPTYEASLSGLHFEGSTEDSGPWGGPNTNCTFSTGRDIISGSFSADGLQLDALATSVSRHSSGVELTTTWHWTGNRN